MRRHYVVLGALALYLPLVAFLAAAGALPLDLMSTYLLVIVLLGVLALSPKVALPVRHTLAVGALLTANVTAIEASGRGAAAQLGFVLVLSLVTLYRSWSLQAFAVSYVAFYYLVLGRAAPDLIFPPGLSPDVAAVWSASFFAAALLGCLPGIAAWFLDAQTRNEAEALRVALTQAAMRERQAAEINDTVVQDLVTAIYASDLGDSDQAATATRRALEAAREIVDSLLSSSVAAPAELLVRDLPAQERAPGEAP